MNNNLMWAEQMNAAMTMLQNACKNNTDTLNTNCRNHCPFYPYCQTLIDADPDFFNYGTNSIDFTR